MRPLQGSPALPDALFCPRIDIRGLKIDIAWALLRHTKYSLHVAWRRPSLSVKASSGLSRMHFAHRTMFAPIPVSLCRAIVQKTSQKHTLDKYKVEKDTEDKGRWCRTRRGRGLHGGALVEAYTLSEFGFLSANLRSVVCTDTGRAGIRVKVRVKARPSTGVGMRVIRSLV